MATKRRCLKRAAGKKRCLKWAKPKSKKKKGKCLKWSKAAKSGPRKGKKRCLLRGK